MEVGHAFYVVPTTGSEDGSALLGESGVGLRRGLAEGKDFQLLSETEWEATKAAGAAHVEIQRHVVVRGSGARAEKVVEVYPLIAQIWVWANGMCTPTAHVGRDGKPYYVAINTTVEVASMKDILWAHMEQHFRDHFSELAASGKADNKAAWDKHIRICAKLRLDGSTWRPLIDPSTELPTLTTSMGAMNLGAPVPNDPEDEDYFHLLIECPFKNSLNASDPRNGMCYLSNVETAGWSLILQVGDYLDAKDSADQWYEARVVAVADETVKVHYMSWSAKFEEVFPKTSSRLAPLHSQTTAWREQLQQGDTVDFRPGENKGLRRDWVQATIVRVVTTVLDKDAPSSLWPPANPRKLIYGKTIRLELAYGQPEITVRIDAMTDNISLAGVHIKAKKPASPVAPARFGHSSASYTALTPPSASYASSYSSSYSSASGYGRPASVYRFGQGKPAVDGVVGLQNLGNTCFLNSVLQCLSNSQPLLAYFLATDPETGEPLYKREINHRNPLGMGGKIATAFAKLLRQLWSGEYTVVSPTNLKFVIGEYAPAFAGYNQQDSQEVLSFILDGLHEDLNRVLDKPYTEPVEPRGRPDEVVAREEWAQYLRRNDSVITDHFMGQLRSHVTCPTCGHESITFDPYMSLSVPVPNQTTVYLMLHPADGGVPTQYGLPVPKEGTVSDAKVALSALSGVPVENLLLATVKQHRITGVCADADDVATLAADGVVAYELELPLDAYECRSATLQAAEGVTTPSPGELALCLVAVQHQMPPISDVLSPVCADDDDDSSYRRNATNHAKARRVQRRLFQTPTVVAFPRAATFAEIHAQVFARVRRLVRADASERPYLLHVTNARVDEILERDVPDTATGGLAPELTRGSLTLTLEWTATGFATGYNDAAPRQVRAHASAEKRQEPTLALRSCFAKFTEREQLGESNTWYCPECKAHVRAFKKFDLYSLPKILLVHLKRFRYAQGAYLLHRDKITSLVTFPIDGLDMNEFVVGPSRGTAPLYDLYAVSEHAGSLGGGHYTAQAKNPRDGRWYSFNDSLTATAEPKDAVTAQAYVLFYLRRDA
ncbi:ubiquitin-specific protease [Achlya hypogyna]|uniref:Ubiquitin-specific protease n=1 Tax=Achlya hypogyna TaxID=1202772 RepID=A0A1V9YFI7_ACHHY|nr:ubiquitin-specific protease [Achlya hypogyna]